MPHVVAQPLTPHRRAARSALRVSLSCACAALCGLVSLTTAAEPLAESGFRLRTIALTDARIVVRPGHVIERGHVLLRDGRIAAVGADIEIPPDADRIALSGHVIYAGFIDAANTRLLDPEAKPPAVVGRDVDFARQALAGMRSDDHSGLTPHFAAAQALRLAAADLEPHHKAGLCTTLVAPTGRIMSGQTALVQLSGLPAREALLRDGQHVTVHLYERRGDQYPATLMGVHAHLRQTALDAARAEEQRRLVAEGVPGVERPPVDPVFDAFTELQRGAKRALFRVETRDDLERALHFAAERGWRPALWGAHEVVRWLPPLQRDGVDVIVGLDFGDAPKTDVPQTQGEFAELPAPKRVREHRLQQWQERVRGLSALERAGLRFGVSTHGLKTPEELFKSLRQAIAQGLSRDGALAALTTHPAAMLGVDDLGRIEPGFLANLVVLTAPLDHEQTKVRYAFIEGRKFEYNREAKPVSAPATPSAADKPLDLAGVWTLQIEAATGVSPAGLELQQTGAVLTGRFTSQHGDGAVVAGKAGPAEASWQVSIGAGDRAVVLHFTARPQGSELRGTLKSPFGAATEWKGQRRAPATPNPIQLTAIEGDETPPVSAVADVSSAPGAELELPTELPSDRTMRPLRTSGNVLIRDAVVLTGTGQTLPRASILVRNGQIAAVGPDLAADEGMTVIDARGRYVMPGIIDTHSHIMISTGLGGVNEATHSIVCEVRVGDVLNTSDAAEYRALAGGVTTIRLLHGSANVIGGQDAVVQLRHGASAAEHFFPGAHTGVKFALGENVKFRQGRFPNTRLGVEATLQRAFIEALDYRRQWQEYERARKAAGDAAARLLPPRRDLRLEALADIVGQQKFIHSHCYRSDEILMLLRVAARHGIRIWSLQHVLEGYKVAPEIVAHGASCSTFADWWAYKVEAFDAAPHNAALLHEAGANVVIKSDDAELMRHLYAEASKPVRYGNLPPESATQLVTLNAARELGLVDRIGSIEVGKQADLAIFNAHPHSSFARCELTLIAGEPYFVRERQPSAMSPAGAARSAQPREFAPRAPQERRPPLDWAAAQGPRLALVGATIYPVDGPVIPRGTLLIENGRIAALGADVVPSEGWPAVDCSGLEIYPGLIDAGTTLGLTEIGKVVETHDFNESGLFQPDLRAGVAVNPDSELLPVARAGGITLALIKPTGGVVSGQSSIIQLGGWTAPEMQVVEEFGLHINWPGAKDRKEQIEQLRALLRAARVYDQARNVAAEAGGLPDLVDPRYEALRPYVKGAKPVLIQADSRQHIAEALEFARQERLKLIITGGADAWKLASRLKEQQVPVIVGPIMRKPVEDYDPFDATYANPGRLYEAGVAFCIRSENAANSRNTPFEAAMAVAYGLPEEIGLRSVTLSAAEILGIADRCGSLTVGKRADLVILDGSPLQITSQVKGVLVAGRPFAPRNRQTDLYDKYRRRLHEVRSKSPNGVAAQ